MEKQPMRRKKKPGNLKILPRPGRIKTRKIKKPTISTPKNLKQLLGRQSVKQYLNSVNKDLKMLMKVYRHLPIKEQVKISNALRRTLRNMKVKVPIMRMELKKTTKKKLKR
jgi:hypothetical protein